MRPQRRSCRRARDARCTTVAVEGAAALPLVALPALGRKRRRSRRTPPHRGRRSRRCRSNRRDRRSRRAARSRRRRPHRRRLARSAGRQHLIDRDRLRIEAVDRGLIVVAHVRIPRVGEFGGLRRNVERLRRGIAVLVAHATAACALIALCTAASPSAITALKPNSPLQICTGEPPAAVIASTRSEEKAFVPVLRRARMRLVRRAPESSGAAR